MDYEKFHEEIDRKLQEYGEKRKRLEKAFHEGEVEREKFVRINKDIEKRMQELVDKKIDAYKEEKKELTFGYLDLDNDLEDRVITEETYRQKKRLVDEKAMDLESRIEALESKEGVIKYFDLREEAFEGGGSTFSPGLWVIVSICGLITLTVLAISFTATLGSIFMLGSALGIPVEYRAIAFSSIFLLPLLLLAALLIGGIIMWISAHLARVKNASFKKSIVSVIAIGVVGFGFQFVLGFLPFGRVLGFIVIMSVSIWIISDVFRTTWKKAGMAWLINLVLGILLFVLILLALVPVTSLTLDMIPDLVLSRFV